MRVVVELCGREPEGRRAGVRGRDPGAPETIPPGEPGAQVRRQAADLRRHDDLVVHLVLRRADQPPLQGPPAPPHPAVAQVAADRVAREHDGVDPQDLHLHRAGPKPVVIKPGEHPGHEHAAPRVQQALHRVDAVKAERREDLGRVVDLVQLPQGRDPVQGQVQEIAAQIPDHEQHHGIGHGQRKTRPGRRLGDPEGPVGGERDPHPHRERRRAPHPCPEPAQDPVRDEQGQIQAGRGVTRRAADGPPGHATAAQDQGDDRGAQQGQPVRAARRAEQQRRQLLGHAPRRLLKAREPPRHGVVSGHGLSPRLRPLPRADRASGSRPPGP